MYIYRFAQFQVEGLEPQSHCSCSTRNALWKLLGSLRGSSVRIGTIQRRLAWPLRKDENALWKLESPRVRAKFIHIELKMPFGSSNLAGP